MHAQSRLAIGLERLGDHDRPEVRAADADVDDVGDRLARYILSIAPERIASENSPMCSSTALTSGMTSLPSTRIGRLDRFRSAMCSTARFSVMLIFSPQTSDPAILHFACRAGRKATSSSDP